MQILLISDIHANFPALKAVEHFFRHRSFDFIINSGDSVVYAPFPNETLAWLKAKSTLSILGNTDKKVIKLLKGQTFTKPSKHEKRIMYSWTAEHLNEECSKYLLSLKNKTRLTIPKIESQSSYWKIGIFHGSPARNHEFLFDTTPDSRFLHLAEKTEFEIVICGHSHVPFHKHLGNTHFINPGSTGRMFDGDPRASCAILELISNTLSVEFFRISYNIEETATTLKFFSLPKIYAEMFRSGRKTN